MMNDTTIEKADYIFTSNNAPNFES